MIREYAQSNMTKKYDQKNYQINMTKNMSKEV